jgi:hypothetical protein
VDQGFEQFLEKALHVLFGEQLWTEMTLQNRRAQNRAHNGQPPLYSGTRGFIQVLTKECLNKIPARGFE